MRTILCFVVAAACLTLLPKPAPGQDKPRLLSINGFMFKGVFSELDPEQARRRLSLADLENLHFDGKSAGSPVDVTAAGRDAWRPSVALDGRGRVIVAWSEQRDGNWDLFACTFDPQRGSFAEPVQLTTSSGTDTAVVLAAAPDGTVWMAWQAWTQGQAEILASPLADRSKPISLRRRRRSRSCRRPSSTPS